MCKLKLTNPGLPAELWDASATQDDSDKPVEDKHHASIDCPAHVYAREQVQNLFQSHITTVAQHFIRPQCNRLADFLL